MMDVAYLETPIGLAEFTGNGHGLARVRVLEGKKPIRIVTGVLEDAICQFNEYFEGRRKKFHLKLNPPGTDFQKKVWKALQQIPYGKTVSYLELSKILGDVKAIRAVAAANGKNPLWIVVPCHRVVGSNGSLTGYAGGLHRKRWLLEHERPTGQASLF